MKVPWIVAGVAVIALVILLVVTLSGRRPGSASDGTTASLANSPAGTPPDISNMTPRERFDRLYTRIMSAAQTGDQATVTQFMPMAQMAYTQLDTVDADARYHLALLGLHNGDTTAVGALADTILQQNPGHLFAYMIRGTKARFAKDPVALKRAYGEFLEHYGAEMSAARQEYTEHKKSIEDFHQAALKPQS
ncbi:MAG: hypothetical protein ABI679_08490 [Gemmatimonadota bacterium]